MDITPFVESLRRDLVAAAQASGPEAAATAERLGFALEPAARLALMEAVSQAAAEITAELPLGSVDVRLAGRDLAFVVQAPAPVALAAPPEPVAFDESEDATARITLRLPEAVKARAEEAAARNGTSLNTWLVAVIRQATREGGIRVDVDLSSIPQMINEAMSGFDPMKSGKPGKRMNGWI
ncbi:hypothetical protein BH09ACT11_BH09ACT11_08450 [soil metagenome]